MISKKYNKLFILAIGVLFSGIVLLYYLLDPSNSPYFPNCPFYQFTGYYCTGCGSQRALHDLLHLNLVGAIKHNALFIPALLLGTYHFSIKYLPIKNADTFPDIVYHPKTPILIFTVLILFTILRNIPKFPFSLLAPHL
ncbi:MULTISPECIES: DUF2752 domain-containing protein [Arenibacter]|uniref:DUF2752 domain-containing protein n=1 Tax=Arenibacter TaxID=178469 RepID=UPI00159335B2